MFFRSVKNFFWPILFLFSLIVWVWLLGKNAWFLSANVGLYKAINSNGFLPDYFWSFISSAADFFPVVFLVAFLFIAIYEKNHKKGFFFLAIIAIGYLLKILLNFAVNLERPSGGLVYCGYFPSFPSGHTLAAIILGGSFYLVAQKRKKRIILAISLVAVFLIGFSRIRIGCHWPADVVGSILLGLFVLSLAGSLLKYLEKDLGKRILSHL